MKLRHKVDLDMAWYLSSPGCSVTLFKIIFLSRLSSRVNLRFLCCLNENKANEDVKYVNFGWNLRLDQDVFHFVNTGNFGSGIKGECYFVSFYLQNSRKIRFSNAPLLNSFVYFFF